MTYNPKFKKPTWFPPERNIDKGALGTLVLEQTTFTLRESSKHPGLITAACSMRPNCCRKSEIGRKNQFKCRLTQGKLPWEKEVHFEGSTPTGCCANLPDQAKIYGVGAPGVLNN